MSFNGQNKLVSNWLLGIFILISGYTGTLVGQEGRIAVPSSNYLREISLYRAYGEVQILLSIGDTNGALCRINSVLDSVGSGPVSLYLGYLQYFKASIYRSVNFNSKVYHYFS